MFITMIVESGRPSQELNMFPFVIARWPEMSREAELAAEPAEPALRPEQIEWLAGHVLRVRSVRGLFLVLEVAVEIIQEIKKIKI